MEEGIFHFVKPPLLLSGTIIALTLTPFLGQRVESHSSIRLADSNSRLSSSQVIDGPEQLASLLQTADQAHGMINAARQVVTQAQHEPDCTVVACIALTYDDGPDKVTTLQIVNTLAQENAKATFFLVGNRVMANADVVKLMYQNGDEIGNHSWSHPNFNTLTASQMAQQVNDTQAVISQLGVPAPNLFRLPYGDISPLVRSQVQLPIIMWNVDPKDWSQTDPTRVVQNVASAARPGAIVVMHSTKAVTAAATDNIIKLLKTRYQLVTVSQLLNLPQNARGGAYFGRY